MSIFKIVTTQLRTKKTIFTPFPAATISVKDASIFIAWTENQISVTLDHRAPGTNYYRQFWRSGLFKQAVFFKKPTWNFMKINSNISRHPLYSLLLPLFICLLINLFQVRTLYAQQATITDFTVSNSESQLTLYLTVTDCFTDDMLVAIHNGIPATFTFYVDIYRKRSNWPDKKIEKYEFNHIMEYDSLKKEYKIKREEKTLRWIRY